MAEFRPSIVREGYENGYGEMDFITPEEWSAHTPELNALDYSVCSILEAAASGVMKKYLFKSIFIIFAHNCWVKFCHFCYKKLLKPHEILILNENDPKSIKNLFW
jgi:hypothetical protein